jgi:predicted PP-loop superfamily ATPase
MPYEALSDDAKELDRAIARWHLERIERLGAEIQVLQRGHARLLARLNSQ